MPYPWHDGDTLTADDLNSAIADAANGPEGPPGDPGVMILTGTGPPTDDAPDGTTYFDLSNGDVWQFSGGGGAGLDWVPADAVIHIDLVGGTPQGRAWTAAAGEVAVDTLLGSDPNTENGWSASLYDPAKLTPDGYATDGSNAPALIGSALSMLLDAATVVVSTKRVSGSSSITPIIAMSADGNDAVEIDLNSGTLNMVGSSYGGSFTADIPTIVNTGPGAINCIAVTLTASRCDIAANGSTAVAGMLASEDRPPGNPLVAAMVDTNLGNTLQFITVYAPLLTTAGLAELSDTDVPNTAPTGIAISWFAAGSYGSDGTYARAYFQFATPGEPSTFCTLAMMDAEGNPGTFTWVDDNGGLFAFDPSNPALVGFTSPPGNGSYNFTVQASEPSGSHVQQEFTVVVVESV